MKRVIRLPNRFARTTKRLLTEVYWLRTEQKALQMLEGRDHIGVDFFLVAYTALGGDRLIRLVRVFENSKKVASFWYLYRCDPKRIEQLLKVTGTQLSELEDLSDRLRVIRNKVFVHIDKQGVFNPSAIYQLAAIKGKSVQQAIEALWHVFSQLYREVTGTDFQYDEYSGDDILRLLELRARDPRRLG
ncbi:MAG: hypothetical protein HY726_19075 [Candidatus Rokubacteria bacterium]|nr:hypothetical protein [Candidatus Rokubacteria bacterium]